MKRDPFRMIRQECQNQLLRRTQIDSVPFVRFENAWYATAFIEKRRVSFLIK